MQAIAFHACTVVTAIALLGIVYPFRPFRRRRVAVAVAAGAFIAGVVTAGRPPPSWRATVAATPPPAPVRPAPLPHPAIWTTPRNTIACRSIRSAEGFALTDAMGKSAGARNLASDTSQTDCRHIKKGERFALSGRRVSDVLEEVTMGGVTYYVLREDVVAAK